MPWPKRSLALRWGSLALLSAAVAKLLLVDTFVLETDYSAFRPVINFGFLTFVFVLASVLFAAYAYWKQREQLEERERFIYPALLILGNVVALWVFQRGNGALLRRPSFQRGCRYLQSNATHSNNLVGDICGRFGGCWHLPPERQIAAGRHWVAGHTGCQIVRARCLPAGERLPGRGIRHSGRPAFGRRVDLPAL